MRYPARSQSRPCWRNRPMPPNSIRLPSFTPRHRLTRVCVWVSWGPVRVIAPDTPAPAMSTAPIVTTHRTVHRPMGGVIGCDGARAGVVMHLVIVFLFNVAGLVNQRVFVVGECVLCGFLDVVGGVREIFERGDGVRAEVEGSIASDGSGAEPEEPVQRY